MDNAFGHDTAIDEMMPPCASRMQLLIHGQGLAA
jgi:hypothetical protein